MCACVCVVLCENRPCVLPPHPHIYCTDMIPIYISRLNGIGDLIYIRV